jgi:hypothetical protein
MRVRSPTRLSRSRLGRLASSSSTEGTATVLQCPRAPRSQPRNTRPSIAVSSRSVLARLCSREIATLVGWIICVSTPRDRSHRAARSRPGRPRRRRPCVSPSTRLLAPRPAIAAINEAAFARPTGLSYRPDNFRHSRALAALMLSPRVPSAGQSIGSRPGALGRSQDQ